MSNYVTPAVLGLAAVAAATALAPSSVSAAPFGDPGNRAGFTLSGEFSFSQAQDTNSNNTPDLGEDITLSNTPNLSGSQTQEFNAIVDPTSSGAPTLASGTPSVTISDGPANVGFTLTFGYNRGLGSLGGSETGQLEFTINDVTSASISGAGEGQATVSFEGLGSIVDNPNTGGDFYDDDQPFSVSFSGTILNLGGDNLITGSYSASFSSPPDPSIVPVPASFGLLGAGLIGLGLAARRRARS